MFKTFMIHDNLKPANFFRTSEVLTLALFLYYD